MWTFSAQFPVLSQAMRKIFLLFPDVVELLMWLASGPTPNSSTAGGKNMLLFIFFLKNAFLSVLSYNV